MSTELYDQWIRSRRSEPADFDIADTVMRSIRQAAPNSGFSRQLRQHLETALIYLQTLTHAWARTGVLIAGGLIGLVRVAMLIYGALFA